MPAANAASSRPDCVKVASYNIRKGLGIDGQRSAERILSVIDEIGPDILALQEADRRFGERKRVLPEAMLAEAGWQAGDVAVRAASMGWHGNALLVRNGIRFLAADRIPLPTVEPRGAVVADLARPDGAELRIVGMHLDLSGVRRRQQIRAILANLARRPPMRTILLGDFNEWQGPLGCMSLLTPHFCAAATGPSFPSRRPIAKLDRILVSREMTVKACGVHRSPAANIASDHLPIWAVIEGAG